MAVPSWRSIARSQGGLITRAQLREAGIDRWAISHNIAAGRWLERAPMVIGTTTGTLSREETMWLGVLHGGKQALIAGLTAAERHGLRNWHRDAVTILVPYGNDIQHPIEGVRFIRTRKALGPLRSAVGGVPVARLEPAILLWAAAESNDRTSQGVLAAAVQQRLTTPESLHRWIDDLAPLRKAPLLRRALADMAGGAQSVSEMDVRRMCRAAGIATPRRQVKRRDSEGRVRFTDCEWRLENGQVLILEVDGGFHMEVEHWEDDLARQRALSTPDRIIVRCTTRELRDEPEKVGGDLRRLGVPRAA